MMIKDYFAFTRGEKRGAVILLLIIVCLIAANFSIDYFKSTQQTDFSEFENAINQFEKDRIIDNPEEVSIEINLFEFDPNTTSDEEWKKLGFKDWQIKTINNYKTKGGSWKTKNDVSKIYGLDSNHYQQLKPFILLPENIEKDIQKNQKNENTTITYFEFNPNTISKEEWTKLGFKDWQIKTIFNYKAKGGSWKTKTDVSKIYGLSEENYQKLEPYILLTDEIEKTNITPTSKNYNIKINVNTADAKELTNLKGINSEKYAAIIIKYRTSLGGFIKKEQLKEVWNLSEATYNGFENQIDLGNKIPIQLNINNVSAEELKKHPYIDWKTANAIEKYRKANGKFKVVSDIKKIHLISDEIYHKIAPYLKID
jgi:competence protein ComEA